MMKVPFNRPWFPDNTITYLAQCLKSGHTSGDGPFTKKAHQLLAEITGSAALLTTSCTDALELSALLLHLEPGDEVILPSYTFVSTANAFLLRGARPVFADIREDTLNIDEHSIARLIGSRTKAIVVMHYAGVGCEMDPIMRLAAEAGLPIVEDNAHGLFGGYKGRRLGTFGAMATLSFHETKNITCGEGGALLLNDPSLIPRAEILREKGTNRSRFFRGEVDKYTWVDLGSSFLPSELSAATLCAQLEARDSIQAGRRRLFERYMSHLGDWASSESIRMPSVPEHCTQSYHMFYLLLPDQTRRDAFLQHMKAQGIMAVFHYLPLHQSPMGARLDPSALCPVSERVSARLARLPFFNGMAEQEQDAVITAARKFQSRSTIR